MGKKTCLLLLTQPLSKARDRRDQARDLLRLNPDVDTVYLERRIREESFGDYGVDDIES